MKKSVKIISLVLSSVMILGMLTSCKPSTNGKTENPAIGKQEIGDLIKQPEEGTLASVNGKNIKQEDVDKILPVLRYIYQKNPEDDDWENFYNYAVEYVASGLMYDLIVSDNNIEVDNAKIDESLESIKNSTGNPDEFYEDIAKYEVTEDMIREFLRYDITYTAIYEYATKDCIATDEEIQKYFDENKEALTNVTTRDFYQIGYDTREDAQKDLDRILAGEVTFDDVLEEQGKEENGYMATVAKDELVDPFEDVVWDMTEDEVYAEVLESSVGFHIITVRNFVENHTYELDEVKDRIAEIVKDQNEAEAMNKFLNDSMMKYQYSIYTSTDEN